MCPLIINLECAQYLLLIKKIIIKCAQYYKIIKKLKLLLFQNNIKK